MLGSHILKAYSKGYSAKELAAIMTNGKVDVSAPTLRAHTCPSPSRTRKPKPQAEAPKVETPKNEPVSLEPPKTTPDMVFMDVQMPEMDGYEATRRIRALEVPGAKTIPIIAMTANVFREDIEKGIAAGMNAHVGKPLNLDDVLCKLRTYLPQGRRNSIST
jgi:CheY-like chemotaxis protein